MKILHTSDWHVGKTLRGVSRIEEQAAVLSEISHIAESNHVDLVIVAGDVFDTAAPAPDAERVAYRALLDLARTGASVLVLSGNHDNDRRLQAVQPVFDRVGVVVRPVISPNAIESETRSGERYRCAAIPWIAKHNVVKIEQLLSMDDADAQQHYAERVRQIVSKLCESLPSDAVNVLAAHMAMPLDDVGEEVRQAQVMDYVVPSTIFPSALHYVALGHYHRPIEVAGACPIRYSGAPMWLGFPRKEHENDSKGVYIVDAAAGLPPSIEFQPVASGKRLRTLRGSMDELESISRSGEFQDTYLRIYVRDQSRAGLAKQVREWFPNTVDVNVDPEQQPSAELHAPRAGRAPGELFREYLDEQQAFDERVTKLFDKLLDEAHAPDPA
ncbi:MAG: exonuclease SbcCD subunit D [Actinomycetota bacterium]